MRTLIYILFNLISCYLIPYNSSVADRETLKELDLVGNGSHTMEKLDFLGCFAKKMLASSSLTCNKTVDFIIFETHREADIFNSTFLDDVHSFRSCIRTGFH